MSASSPYQVPRHPGRWRAIALAIIVHLALLAFLWFGIHWQSETPLAVEAEIWDRNIREAAPLPAPSESEPEPPKAVPQPVKPLSQVEEPVVVKPDIALEKEKEKKRKKQERQRALEQEKQTRLAREKEIAERLKKEKQEADKKLAQQKEETEIKKKNAADKLAAEKKQKQQTLENKAAEQRRQDNLKRMMNQASSNSGGTGDAAKSQGPSGSPDYQQKIGARIVSNISFPLPPNLVGNPPAEYMVELFPDGSVRRIQLKKPSGVTGFDEAVERAIYKSQPFPPDKDGKVPNTISVIHKPKDSKS